MLMRLTYVSGRGHAPMCMDMKLYRDTGGLLCHQIPVYGKGIFID